MPSSTASDPNLPYTSKEWTLDDLYEAEHEGWWLDVVAESPWRHPVQKRDVGPFADTYFNDAAALAFVMNNPSPLHDKALRLAIIARLES